MKRFVIVVFLVISHFLLFNNVFAMSHEKIEIDLNLEANDVAYTFFDLSNGECTLIQSGKGKNVLVNTGSRQSQEELARRLNMYNVDKIDAIIITNESEEFTGNVRWIVDEFQVEKLYVPDVIRNNYKMFNVRDKDVIGLKEGDQKKILPALKINIIYVETKKMDEIVSMVASFSYGKQTVLFMEIADVQVENELAKKYPLKSTILKVADFGSNKGTSQLFLEKVDPQVAILFQKHGRNVSELVIERLQETWIDIYQTQYLGTVSIKCHKNDYEILTFKPELQENSFSFVKAIFNLAKKIRL